ncbi:MAG: hypothetical protein KDC95_16655, partial [Planctomycetes bacterium]|nr:hypothetical protein [Planctomycetota bacterium]
MQRIILAAAIACGASLAAQTTHVAVGQQLGTVIQAAQPGDVILFSGTYAPLGQPILIQKPLFIHGKNGARITLALSFEVSKISAGQSFVLQDVEVDKILVKDCDGPVLLAGIKTATFYGGPKIEAVNCKDLTIEEFSGGNVTVTGSHVSIKNSTIQGSHYNSRVNPFGGQHGIWSINSTVLLGATRAIAGAPQVGVRAGLSLDITSHATIAGDCTLQAYQGIGGGNYSAVAGLGTVVYNAAATFLPVGNAPGLDANLTTSTRRVPVTG